MPFTQGFCSGSKFLKYELGRNNSVELQAGQVENLSVEDNHPCATDSYPLFLNSIVN
jgi:hypothetical protein